jgi:hypothetical protein
VSLEIGRRRDALVVTARRAGGRTLTLELPLLLPVTVAPTYEQRLVPVSA